MCAILEQLFLQILAQKIRQQEKAATILATQNATTARNNASSIRVAVTLIARQNAQAKKLRKKQAI